jgi:arylsulfatase A-like enzyme
VNTGGTGRLAAAAAAFCLVAGVAAGLGLLDVASRGRGLSAAEGLQAVSIWLALALPPALVGGLLAGVLCGRGASGAERTLPFALAAGFQVAMVAAVAVGAVGALPAAALVALSVFALLVRPGGGTFARRLSIGCLAVVGFSLAVAPLAAGLRGAAPVPLGSATVTPGPGLAHVVLVVLDTTRRDHLGAYGADPSLTPALDAFARHATVYADCFAPASWTVPSHASMFTGLPPRSHGASFEHHRWLDDGFVTLAEQLRDAGYRTAAFSANPQLRQANLDQGFSSHRALGEAASLMVRPLLLALGGPARFMDQGASEAVSQVEAFLASARPTGQPIFLFLNLMEAHWRYLPPWRERLAVRAAGLDPLRATLASARFYGPIAMAGTPPPPADRAAIAALYAASVRYQDRRLAELLASVDRHLAAENSLVIVTADHGENLGESGRWDHVFAVNDHLIRVPLLIRYPRRFPPGRTVAGLCQTTDLPATVADVTGAFRPAVPGRSLAPDRFEPRSHVFAEGDPYLGHLERMAQRSGFQRDVARWNASLRAVRDDRHKYVWSSRSQPVLYDLREDPDESRDVLSERPGVAESLRAALEAWQAATPAYQAAAAPEAPRAPELEQLRSLGYVE